MSVWSDNPDWFDEWIFNKALEGDFGESVRLKAEKDEIEPDDLWDLDKNGKLCSEACQAYCERQAV